jgi:D-alanyl-D-alanine carboxypeptidase/D-alanyl-D-alanine-endopeptidase (penicillin-binding protein 4)
MPSPPVVASQSFKKILEHSGIDVGGKVVQSNGDGMVEKKGVAIKKSPSLKDIIKALNVNSNNLYAEHLLRELGRVVGGNSSLNSGLDVVTGFWEKKEIFLDGFYMTDGSGLSRSNAICGVFF